MRWQWNESFLVFIPSQQAMHTVWRSRIIDELKADLMQSLNLSHNDTSCYQSELDFIDRFIYTSNCITLAIVIFGCLANPAVIAVLARNKVGSKYRKYSSHCAMLQEYVDLPPLEKRAGKSEKSKCPEKSDFGKASP